MATAKHEPFYYWQRMLSEFSSAKGCHVGYFQGELSLTYHETKVARWNLETGEVTLCHGGWLTYYTKERVNRFLDVLDIGAGLHQHRKVWYVTERENGLERAWTTLSAPEDSPDTFTLATKLSAPGGTTGADDCTGEPSGVPINEASSVPPASNASNPLGSRQNE